MQVVKPVCIDSDPVNACVAIYDGPEEPASESDTSLPKHAAPAIEAQERRIETVPSRVIVSAAERDPVRLTVGTKETDGHDVADLQPRRREGFFAATASEVVAAKELFTRRA